MDNLLKKTITFDRFIRGFLIALGVVALVLLLRRLSGVLLPFFIAWLFAYLLDPLVDFFQYKCKFKYRILGILASFLLVGGVIYGIFMLMFPPMWQEVMKLKDMLVVYLEGDTHTPGSFSEHVKNFLAEHLSVEKLKGMLTVEGLVQIIEESMPTIWSLVSESAKAISGIFSVTMVILYTLFILLDYDRLAASWPKLFPEKFRGGAVQIVKDIGDGMNKYFRGQALVSLCVGILFSIGFLIINFPMAISLGLFIGLLSLVPYLHSAGLIPTVLFSAVKAADTGQSFWLILISALAVFAVVQTIQDAILTPKIMGKVTGLNAAIILLSLSIWGSLLGILGMIIAIPMTTLIITYYQRYIVKHTQVPGTHTGPPAEVPEVIQQFENPEDPEDDTVPSDAKNL